MSNTVELTLFAKDQASGVVNGVTGALRGMLGQLTMLAGLGGAGFGLGALVKQGIDFNRTMEDSKGGIAGVLLMTREYVNEAGKVVGGQAAMNAAFAEASVIQEKLKKDALQTAASYTDLVQAFQNALAPAATAGVTKLDDVREITVMATQAMAALGIPTVQAAQELRGLFSGDTGPDNRLNQVLRITKADLEAVRGDADAAAKLFKDKLGPAAQVAALQTGTFTVRLSNLGDILDQTMGEATKSLFKDLSGLIAEVSSGIGENAGLFKDLGETIAVGFGVVKETIGDVVGMLSTDVKDAGLTWRETFLIMETAFLGLVESVGSGVKFIVQYFTAPIETVRGVWKSLIGGIASLLSEFLAKVADVPVLGKFFKAGAEALDTFVVNLTSGDAAFDRFAKKSQENFGDSALSRTKKFLDEYGKGAAAAGAKAEELGSRAKKGLGIATEAAYHFGSVWAAESAKASAALEKFLGEFAGFTGDTVGEATAKIEKEYDDLVGQLGQMMFQAKVPFEKGLAMLEKLAEAKGKKITAAVFNGEAAVEEFISVFDAALTKDNALLGIKVAWDEIANSIPGAARSAADAVKGVWSSMGRAFDDLFFNVLSGKLDSLGDVFRNFADGLTQTFAKLITDMVQRWLMGQQTISEGLNSLSKSMMNSSGTGLSTTGGLMAAGAGYGIGSIIGPGGTGNQVGGALGAVGGAALGAKLGSVYPIVGTIVGAIVGAIIGGLFNKNTERVMTGSIGNMWSSTSRAWAPGERDPETGKRGPGQWVTYTTGPKTAFERQGLEIFQSQAASFADIFRIGAKDQSKALTDAYQKALKDSISGGNFRIAAGSEEDIQKDAEYLLKNLLPRIGLSAAFGQKGYLPTGYRDRAGGVPGINYGLPGMNADGTWIEKQLFDPEAPIPKMLAGLGFTESKIAELAGRISTDDPEKLMAYLKGVVSVVVGIRNLGAEMGKTYGELTKGWADETAKGQAAAFGESAQSLADQWNALSLYSGDEQLTKAQEAQAASDEFWKSVVSYLQQLDALGQKLSAGFQSMREKMRAFLNPLSESQQTTADWSTVNGTWGRLQNAKTPAEIEAASNEAAAAIERMFATLSERVTRGKALMDRLTTLTGNLWNLGKDVAAGQLEQANPLAAWGKDLVDIQGKVGAAAQKSGLEQIAAIEDVAAAGESVYAKLKAFITEIASVRSGVNKSIDSQIWELGVGEMDSKGQASAVTQRIKDLQEQLKIATSPAEIQAITSEIQQLTTRYVGTFGKDDKDRGAAIAWAKEQLERTKGLANDALDILNAQAKALADELSTTLKTATGLISTNVTDASTAIGQLSHTLNALDTEMQNAIKRLGKGALDALEPLRKAMNDASGIFTGATGAAATALTAPEVGFNASVDKSAARLDLFTGALDRAISKLNSLAGAGDGSGTGAGPKTQGNGEAPSYTQTAAPSGREMAAAFRRYRMSLTPRTA